MSTSLRVTKAVVFEFTILNSSGAVDATTPVVTGSTVPSALRCVINPSNPREAAAVAVSMTGVNLQNPLVQATITAFGRTSGPTFSMSAAPDLSAVTIGAVGVEVDVPTWAV
jgi:hypothetical protein